MTPKEFNNLHVGKKAHISGKHPHAGCVATCKGVEKTISGWGIKFQKNETGEEFYVFSPKTELTWVDSLPS